jgi:L-lactate utilization protein LutB
MLPTYIVEPVHIGKLRALSSSLITSTSSGTADLGILRDNVKKTRLVSVDNMGSLMKRLVDTLHRYPSVEVITADDAEEATQAVQQVCGATKTIAVNESSVVTQELVPMLARAGLQIVRTYSTEVTPFENRFTAYHQLPRTDGSYLANSFGSVDLVELRKASIKKNGVREFVAVLGVNAIAAEDGTVFFVQHFRNISKAFEQAQKLVLVVALDKVVFGALEARLQAIAAGVFGWEARLLRLGSRAGGIGLDDLPFGRPGMADSPILVIIMDNGRRRLMDSPYRSLLACIGCRACIRSCPSQRFFGADTGWSPKEYLYYFVQGVNPSLNLCLSCGLCRVECPIDIDLPSMMIRAKGRSGMANALSGILFSNLEALAKWSCRLAGVVNAILEGSMPRWFIDAIFGVSKEAPMPNFSQYTLSSWLTDRSSQSGG